MASSCGTAAAAEIVAGVAGVHPAEQGLDEPVDDLVAEPGGDEVADRDVVVGTSVASVSARAPGPAPPG